MPEGLFFFHRTTEYKPLNLFPHLRLAQMEQFASMTTNNKIREVEDQIADLKARLPPHSVPPALWQQLEHLEEELEKLKRKETDAQKNGVS